MSDKKDETKKAVDPELDDLLDSALQDMTKKPEPPAAGGEVPQNMWSEEFIKEAAAQFESNMAAILGSFSGVPEGECFPLSPVVILSRSDKYPQRYGDKHLRLDSVEQITQDQIASTFSKMAEAAAHVLKPGAGEAAPDPELTSDPVVQEKIDEVSAAISQTLQNLNTNSETLQTPFSDADLANMFTNFNMGEGTQENNMFVPFMQGMMQSLLSKEVLYPSLKELVDKYPAWLDHNRGKIEQAEFDRFSKQQELMKKVCAELEPEEESDPDDVKRKRFETVLELMQKMQDLGQPPTELVGDIASPPQGFAPPVNDGGQCSIM